MKALLLSAILLAAPPASDETLDHRMQVGRLGAVVAFVVATAGLGLLMRHLGKQARTAEEEARLEHAFREIEEGLANPAEEPSQPMEPMKPTRPTRPTRPTHEEF